MDQELGGQKFALLLCLSAIAASTISTTAYAPILALIKSDLRLSYTEAGMITSAYFIGYALAQIPWGLMVDRYGGRRVLSVSVFAAGASTSLFALSGTGLMASLLRLISGLSAAGIFVPSVRVVSELFPQNRRGAALGTLGISASVSVLVLGLASPYAANNLGWRWTIHLFAAVSIIDAVILWSFLKDARPNDRNAQPRRRPFVKDSLTDMGFWFLGYVQFSRYGVDNLLLAWLTIYLLEAFALPLWLAGATLSTMFAITIVSNPAGGFISDRVGRIPVISTSLLVLSGLLGALALNKSEPVLWALLAGVGWLVEFYRGPLFALVPERYGIERTGSLTGAQNTFAAAGAFAVPLLYGYLRDLSGSFTLGWLVIAGVALAAAILSAVLSKVPFRAK